MKQIPRHAFLRISTNALLGLAGLLGVGGLVRYFSYHADPEAPSEFDLGDASAYPVGSRTVRSDIPALIEHPAGEFVAHSLICTHLGCMVEENEAGFACPCHGSRFGKSAELLQGPAQKPLRRLRVEVSEDHHLKLYTRE